MIPKFRAWDKLTDTVQDVLDINFKEKTVTVSQKGIVWYKHDNLRSFEDLILMQSTGFKDNNDTEVFEGDVINIHWFYADFDPVELGAFENEEYAERVTVKKNSVILVFGGKKPRRSLRWLRGVWRKYEKRLSVDL